jgi:purine-binding chemotaxis protein CheW
MEATIELPVVTRPAAGDRAHCDERPAAAMSGLRGYLTFRLGHETYCIDILHVQEIRGYSAPTRIAEAPPAIKGVVNLRGTIVPVVELRHAFDIPEPRYDAVTATIVVSVAERKAGLIVDAVADVVEFPPEQLSPPPLLEGAGAGGFITGLATVKTEERSELFIVLDIARLLAIPAIGLG